MPPPSSQFPSSVVVIGGRGFVGSHIVRHLLDAGARVHVFGPPMDTDLLADLRDRITETSGSVEDRIAILDAIRTSGAEAVVTTAAFSVGEQGLMTSGDLQADRAFAVNVDGLRNVLDASHEAGIGRVVWTASTVVYGPPDRYPDRPVNEDAPCAPVTLYGLTKRLAEDVAQFYRDRHGMDVVGLRLPLVIGPALWYSGTASSIAGMISAAVPDAHSTVSFHDEPVDFMDASDVAMAIVAVLDLAKTFGAIYNINGFTARVSEIVDCVEKRVPGYCVTHETVAPKILIPLIDDGHFRRDAGFAPARGLRELVEAMLPPGI